MIIASTSNTAFAVAGEVFAQVEDFQLVGEVEERGRLVQEQDGCLLREDHGDPYFLPVAAMPWSSGRLSQSVPQIVTTFCPESTFLTSTLLEVAG
jgi:hypothetical protein